MRTSTRWIAGAVAGAVLAAVGVAPRAEAAPTFARQSGLDRYGTAAAVSSVAFPTGAPVAYLASGEDFPDALAVAPLAAAAKGPILLVRRNALPNATAAELDRLDPAQIVLVGGPAAIAPGMVDAVAPYTGEVRRIEGADRFDTAAKVAQAFTGPLPMVFVASGRSFPDALSGGPALAATTGGPILLVEPGSVPAATAAELTRLAPTDIRVLGGPAAVSDAVLDQLDQYVENPVGRRAGADRYATSVLLSQTSFPSATTVYLANGEQFADALAAGAVAARDRQPLLLVRRDCIPAAADFELTRLNPTTVVVLGGEAAVGPGVLARQTC